MVEPIKNGFLDIRLFDQTMENKKVAIIGTVGLPAQYGGFETLAHHLTEKLNENFDFTVYCSSKRYEKRSRKKTFNNSTLKYIPFKANGIQSIIYDAISILHSIFYADVLLILGVSGAFMIPFVKTFTNKKIITSIDGIEWKREKWNTFAKLYLFIMESVAVKYSHVVISDNEAIQNYTGIRFSVFSKIIEYGGDHCTRESILQDDIEKYPFLSGEYLFKVARIEKENNIAMILEAFAKLPEKTFVLVGNWGNSDYGINLKEQYSKYPNLILLNPIYDSREINLLRTNCSLYVHGHSAGGTNPSLVEAMCLQLPILSFSVSYNRVTTESKAFYFSTSQDIINTIHKMDDGRLRDNAEEMYRIAMKRYTWDVVSYKYMKLINKVLISDKVLTLNPRLSSLSKRELQSMGLSQYFNLQLNDIRTNNYRS